jgi:hypothetical protein
MHSTFCTFFLLQIKRPSKYDSQTAFMLGPVMPDPTIDLRGLVMVKQAGTALGVGAEGTPGMPITGRYERNWNTLYVGGLPMDWGEMQVRGLQGKEKGTAACRKADLACRELDAVDGQLLCCAQVLKIRCSVIRTPDVAVVWGKLLMHDLLRCCFFMLCYVAGA